MQKTSNQLIVQIRQQLGEDGFERLAACESDEERLQLLKDSGVELPDELLDGIAGGGVFDLLRWLGQKTWNEIQGLIS
ncbi:MAG: hypothetical protein IJ203_09035 [Atopobiaceae bacterium]|jgi:hypothetical protein|nr:hypothetical protein [Atopobiaceae bacterium]